MGQTVVKPLDENFTFHPSTLLRARIVPGGAPSINCDLISVFKRWPWGDKIPFCRHERDCCLILVSL